MPQMLLLIRDMELIYVTVNVDDLLAGIIDTHPNSGQLKLESFDGNYNISCDVELINQAFSAVFTNAIQFSNDLNDKIHISVQILENIPFYFNKSFMQIRIADSGIGIPDEYIPLVFKPFFTTHKSAGHAGFGLSIAQKIINAHGGYINISSETDTGSCVSILLPIEMKQYEEK
jgi:OmpR-family two-component system manganese-sensing sensor histidine kinase